MGSSTVTLYTIQARPAYEKLQQQGVLRNDREMSMIQGYGPEFSRAYQWMVRQMKQRLGEPPEADVVPIWAWSRYKSDQPKPDLDNGGHLEPGTEGVMLTVELSVERLLFSDFDDWHHALNYWYLPEDETDRERFEERQKQQGVSMHEQKPLPDDELHEEIMSSWERMFVPVDQRDDSEGHPRLQATCWEIHEGAVRDVTPYHEPEQNEDRHGTVLDHDAEQDS